MWIFSRLLAAVLIASLYISPASAQGFNTGGGGGGSGGGGVSLSPGCGATATPNPITSTGIFGTAIPVTNVVSAATYTIRAADACGLLIAGIGAAVFTLPAATTAGFGANTYWRINNQTGADLTINVTGPSNLDGSATVTVVAGTAMAFQSDGTNYHFVVRSAPGIGTVTSLTGSCGVAASPTPLTNAGAIQGSAPPTIITAANPPIVSSYCGTPVYLNGASDLLATIGQAGSAGFAAGWNVMACSINAAQSITPTGGTIGGLSSYALAGATPQNPICVALFSDGVSDYKIVAGSAGSVQSVSAACGVTTGTGAITTAGTVTLLNVPTLLTGTNVPITANYCGGTEYLSNGSNQIPTIGAAGSTGFPLGWFTGLCNPNTGTQTITPASGTIGGAATKVLAAGTAAVPVCITILSDGISNFYIR